MREPNGNLKRKALRACELPRGFRATSLKNELWRRVSLLDYRGRLKSRKNHAFRLAIDNERWESICGTFSVLNVSLVPFDDKAAICKGCERSVAENSTEGEVA